MRALMGSAFLSLLRQHLYGIQRILSALAEQKQLKMTAFKMSFWADFHQPSPAVAPFSTIIGHLFSRSEPFLSGFFHKPDVLRALNSPLNVDRSGHRIAKMGGSLFPPRACFGLLPCAFCADLKAEFQKNTNK